MRWIALTLLAGIPLGQAGAQESQLSTVLSSSSFRGKTLRLSTEQARITGRLIAAGGGEVTLHPAGAPVVVAMQDIDTVWVRKTAAGTGAVVGGVVGAAILATGAHLVLVNDGCDDSVCPNTLGPVGGAILGGVIGAGLGAGLGALIPKWKRRFP